MASTVIYKLRIALEDTDPEVFRVVEVPDWFCFGDLHDLIQDVMPWESAHLFVFSVYRNKSDKRGIRIGIEDEDMDSFGEPIPFYPLEVRLSDVLVTDHVRIKYWYDFGDDWMHWVTVVSRGEAQEGVAYPRVVDGANACPPEDCGGVWEFYELLAAWKARDHPSYEYARAAFGREFDVTAFDLKKADKALARMRKLKAPTELRIKPEIDFGEPAPVKKRAPRKKSAVKKKEKG